MIKWLQWIDNVINEDGDWMHAGSLRTLSDLRREIVAAQAGGAPPEQTGNSAMDAISLLGKWHRAYHDSRDALEKVDDETVAFIAKQRP